jgi:large subunit ribosomal protein L28
MRQCCVTGKKQGKGYKYTIRGIAKKKKGIGLKVTGKTKRPFHINLFTKNFWYPEENRFVRLRLTTSGMRIIDKKGIHAVVTQMRQEGKKV